MTKIAEDAKARALAFLETDQRRAGRPHPDERTERALAGRDADFVNAYVEYDTETAPASPEFFWYHIYSTGTDSHAEFVAKFAPEA